MARRPFGLWWHDLIHPDHTLSSHYPKQWGTGNVSCHRCRKSWRVG